MSAGATKSALDQVLQQIVAGTVAQVASAFIVDRQAQGLSPRTIRAYSLELKYFREFLDHQGVIRLDEVDADVIRKYLIELGTHRNAGGCHIAYRVLKTFTYWWEAETDGDYVSPIRKVKPPKISPKPIQPVPIADIQAMAKTCDRSLLGLRDKAILLALLDTGVRGDEFVSMDLLDIDLVTGQALIRKGKGRKFRYVRLGQKSRRALRAYLKLRIDNSPAVWVTDAGGRLTFSGLRQIIRRRAGRAGLPEPGLHDFRRACGLALHRNGMRIKEISLYLGHSNVIVTERYLRIEDRDVLGSHSRASPVDNADL